MAIQKFKIYVSASLREWELGAIKITDYDPTPHHEFKMKLISSHEIELDVPELDIRDAAIAGLEGEIQKERAESQSRVNIMLDRISKLKAIGHESSVVEG